MPPVEWGAPAAKRSPKLLFPAVFEFYRRQGLYPSIPSKPKKAALADTPRPGPPLYLCIGFLLNHNSNKMAVQLLKTKLTCLIN